MKMDPGTIAVIVIMGLVAGYLAKFVVGGGGGLLGLGYIIPGVLGAFVGAFVLDKLGVNLGIRNVLLQQLATSVIGAIILILLARLVIG